MLNYSAIVNAQVTGFVLDHQYGTPIAGASVSDEDLIVGTQTNINGYFEIKISDFPIKLRVSSVGYITKDVVLQKEEKEMIILLQQTVFESEGLIVTGDRIQISEHEARPVPVTRVKPSDLIMTIHASAPEMLRAEPGVYIQQTTIGQGSVYVRGRSGRDVLYLFNDFRINPGFTRSGQNQYFAAIDPFSVDEIRVYRGPVSVFYGSDALSGGVHVKPDIPSFADTSRINASILGQSNFWGTAEKTGSANIRFQQQRFSLSVTGTLRSFRYYRMPESSNDDRWFPYTNKLNFADMNFGAVTGTGRILLDDTNEISFVSYYSRIPDSPRIDRMILGYDIENSPIPAKPRSGYTSNTAPLTFSAHSLTYRHNRNSIWFSSLRLRAGFHRLNDNRAERDFLSPPNFSHNPGEYHREYSLDDIRTVERNQSNQYLLSADLITPLREGVTLSWGTDLAYESIYSAIQLGNRPMGLPRFPDGSEILSAALFVHVDQNISRNFLLEYGGRFTYIQNRLAFEGPETERSFDPMRQSYMQLTTAAGIRYTINRHFDVTGNLSSGFRAPNIADLAEIGIRRSDQFQSPNINLNPEKSINFDTGFHFKSDIISFETHFFWLHYFDKIEREFTGNIVDREGRFIRPGNIAREISEYVEVQSANVGTMNLYGLELGAKIKLARFVNGGLNFNYIWGELKSTSGAKEPVDRIPPANGIAFINIEAHPFLMIRPQIRYNFSQRRLSPLEVSDNRISKYGTDGFVNMQFVTVYNGIPSIEVKLFADNLFNRSYREHASSLDGLSRNVTVSLAYSF
jgi:hemoglobin/transferrin/lactoferrin receptor protein